MKIIIVCVISIILTLNNPLFARGGNGEEHEIITYLTRHSRNLEQPAHLDELIEAAGSCRLVLLGEASHGTSEYYTWRAEISKRLIAEQGFQFIAVEGDWTAAFKVNQYVKDLPGAPDNAREALSAFERWPPWMWNNREIKELITWLRDYNKNQPFERQVGFYGIDVYGMPDSMQAVIETFEETTRSTPSRCVKPTTA